MAVVVRLESIGIARVEAGRWTSDVPELADVVTRAIDPTIQGSDPDPDLTLARRAIARFGGEILEAPAPWHPEYGIPSSAPTDAPLLVGDPFDGLAVPAFGELLEDSASRREAAAFDRVRKLTNRLAAAGVPLYPGAVVTLTPDEQGELAIYAEAVERAPDQVSTLADALSPRVRRAIGLTPFPSL